MAGKMDEKRRANHPQVLAVHRLAQQLQPMYDWNRRRRSQVQLTANIGGCDDIRCILLQGPQLASPQFVRQFALQQ